MRPQRILLSIVAVLGFSAACVAQDWQPAVVRDVSDSGKNVQVRSDHGELRFQGSGDISQTFAIQTMDSVFFLTRTADGRFAHACPTPVDTKVEVKFLDGGKKLLMDDNGQKYHFNVTKEMTPQQYVAIPASQRHSAMEEPGNSAPQNATLE